MKENIIDNFRNNMPKCQHSVSSKLWIPVKTIRVQRNGFGNAVKTVCERCIRCGAERKHDVSFSDTRIDYKPYIKSSGSIFKNASRRDYKEEIKEHNRIFN